MKKFLCAILTLSTVFCLTACGNNTTPADSADTSQTQETVAQPPDLTGNWEQFNKNSETSYHTATIQGDTIEIYWVMTDTDTTALYWAGSFTPPTTAEEPYTWDSVNDKEKTDTSLLASGDETKTFTYEDGQISYAASALGVTQTVTLEKTE